MPFQGQLARAFGKGLKLWTTTVSITGTGAVTVSGATTVITAVASVTSGTTVTTFQVASISSYSGNVVNVAVATLAGTTNTIPASTALSVDVWALVA